MRKKFEQAFLIVLFVCAIAIRWYKLPGQLFFGFEQGRDAQIIMDIFAHQELKLVGPKTDLDGIFHGAYYYYLMLPAYVTSGGSPVAASFFLVLVSSLLPLIGYFFGRDFFNSKKAGMVTAVLLATSYEYIVYARWLSNVTPAIPLIALAFFALWRFQKTQNGWFFIAAAALAALASQFEIVLILFFAFSGVLLLLTRSIPFPKWKTLVVSLLIAAGIFVPHAVFNLRNQNIIGNSIVNFAAGKNGDKPRQSTNIPKSARNMMERYDVAFRKSLSAPNRGGEIFYAGVLLFGLVVWMRKKGTPEFVIYRKKITFLLCWILMCIPAVVFHDVAQLTQLYLGVGIGLIFLMVLALQLSWQTKIGKILCVAFVICMGWGMVVTIQKIARGQDVFFITIQEGLNFADQQRAFAYIHDDAAGQTYRFTAYTIPYLQPQGWEYLLKHFSPNDKTDNGAKLVYVAIEAQVDPFWIKKWNEEMGSSTLIEERSFGLLRVQKRQLQ